MYHDRWPSRPSSSRSAGGLSRRSALPTRLLVCVAEAGSLQCVTVLFGGTQPQGPPGQRTQTVPVQLCRLSSHRLSCTWRRHQPGTAGNTTRGVQGHLMLRERVAPQSEVIRAIVSGDSPCCRLSSHRLSCTRPDTPLPTPGTQAVSVPLLTSAPSDPSPNPPRNRRDGPLTAVYTCPSQPCTHVPHNRAVATAGSACAVARAAPARSSVSRAATAASSPGSIMCGMNQSSPMSPRHSTSGRQLMQKQPGWYVEFEFRVTRPPLRKP